MESKFDKCIRCRLSYRPFDEVFGDRRGRPERNRLLDLFSRGMPVVAMAYNDHVLPYVTELGYWCNDNTQDFCLATDDEVTYIRLLLPADVNITIIAPCQ